MRPHESNGPRDSRRVEQMIDDLDDSVVQIPLWIAKPDEGFLEQWVEPLIGIKKLIGIRIRD